MGKYTSGPWKAVNNGKHWNNSSIDHWIITFNEDGEQIVDHVYEESDAHLIAAAPELLEALEKLHSKILGATGMYGDYYLSPDFNSATTAIKKAKGETA